MAVSHLDATFSSGPIEHHVRGRNSTVSESTRDWRSWDVELAAICGVAGGLMGRCACALQEPSRCGSVVPRRNKISAARVMLAIAACRAGRCAAAW